MSTSIRSPLRRTWQRSELLDRANRWLSRRAEPPITDSMLLDWKKDGLIPRVGASSLGIGKGSAGGWNASTYRQLLRLLELRHRGIERRRDMRLLLWLEGYSIEVSRVRSDLRDLFTQEIHKANEKLGTAFWPARDDSPPTEAAKRAIHKHFSSPEALNQYIAGFGLAPALESLLQHLTAWALTPSVQGVLTAFAHQLFATGPGELPKAMEALTNQLPPQLRPLLATDRDTLLLHEGMLASPDGFENRVLLAIRSGPDELLINIRDFVRNGNRLWSSGLKLMATVLQHEEGLVPEWFRPFSPLASRISIELAKWRPLEDPGTRILLYGLFLNRKGNADDMAVPLARIGMLCPAIFTFLAQHHDLLANQSSNKQNFNELVAMSSLPDEAKALLLSS